MTSRGSAFPPARSPLCRYSGLGSGVTAGELCSCLLLHVLAAAVSQEFKTMRHPITRGGDMDIATCVTACQVRGSAHLVFRRNTHFL